MFDVRIDKNFICYVGAGDTNGLTVSYRVQASINFEEELMLWVRTIVLAISKYFVNF